MARNGNTYMHFLVQSLFFARCFRAQSQEQCTISMDHSVAHDDELFLIAIHTANDKEPGVRKKLDPNAHFVSPAVKYFKKGLNDPLGTQQAHARQINQMSNRAQRKAITGMQKKMNENDFKAQKMRNQAQEEGNAWETGNNRIKEMDSFMAKPDHTETKKVSYQVNKRDLVDDTRVHQNRQQGFKQGAQKLKNENTQIGGQIGRARQADTRVIQPSNNIKFGDTKF